MRAITYLIIGTIISLLAVGFMLNHMPLPGAILLIIGGSIGLKGRNILDKDDLSRERGMDKKRSKGVTLLGCFWILSGLSIFIEIIWYLLGPLDEKTSGLSAYSPAFGLLLIYMGVGLLKLQDWARIAGLVLGSIAILVILLYILFKPTALVGNLTYYIFVLVYSFGMLFFLTRTKVKEQFK